MSVPAPRLKYSAPSGPEAVPKSGNSRAVAPGTSTFTGMSSLWHMHRATPFDWMLHFTTGRDNCCHIGTNSRDHGVWPTPSSTNSMQPSRRTSPRCAPSSPREAKQRGDTDAAKQITGARKPTTAAWVVNRLVHADDAVRRRLTDLGERLRAAHAAMDGETIRALSAEQRRLVEDLARAGFEEAEIAEPTAALRDDVTGTLQAAVADPDVAARLGRLTKAEQWSGFGEFGDTAIVFKPTRSRKAKAEPEPPQARRGKAARRQPGRATSPSAGGARHAGRRRAGQGRGRRRGQRVAVRPRDGAAAT